MFLKEWFSPSEAPETLVKEVELEEDHIRALYP